MSSHKEVLDAIVKNSKNQHNVTLDHSKDDDELYRLLFSNFRKYSNGEIKGLRLSNLGLTMTRLCFANWTLKMPKDFKIKPCHLIYLDRTCTMPWFLSDKVLILFETQLAMRAKLVGDLDNLMTAFC